MRKFFCAFFVFFMLITAAYASDLRFAQVDGVMYSANDELSEQRLDKIINEINNQKNISFVVFSGNNIAKPSVANLEAFLKETKKLHAPYYLVLGNKDVNKQKGLGKTEYMKLVSKTSRAHKKIHSPNYVFEKKGVVFIVVDGSKEVIPTPMGYYKPEVVTWLDEQLNLYSEKNVVIIQHFPIIPPVQRESLYTAKPEAFLKVIAKHKNIKAIVSGHFGVNKESDIKGIKFISTAEAPVYKIIDIMDCESKKPVFWSIIKE